jgi:hypothetical protein
VSQCDATRWLRCMEANGMGPAHAWAVTPVHMSGLARLSVPLSR